MIKRLTAYSTIALALCACSDEAYVLPNGIGEDGSLEIRLAVPQMQQVATRATDEYAVGDLTMLVLSNGTVAQMTEYTAADLKDAGNNQYSLSVSIAPELRGATDLKFYFIANNPATDGDLDEGMAERDVKNVTYVSVVNADQTMPMCGSASLSDLTGGNAVALWRNAAKVTVQNGTPAKTVWWKRVPFTMTSVCSAPPATPDCWQPHRRPPCSARPLPPLLSPLR